MPEVQLHGFDFENWVKKTFFAAFNVSYSHKWDVPAEFNKKESYQNIECSLFSERVPNPFVSETRVFKPKLQLA